MYIISKKGDSTYSLPVKELACGDIGAVSSPFAQRILKLLAKGPIYPLQIAKQLKQNEQKVYYHIHNLLKRGIIRPAGRQMVNGAKAVFYELSEPGFVVRFRDYEKTQKIALIKEEHKRIIEPFVRDGKLDARIIVGSPDPHGPNKARSRDGYYGMDLALFFGTFLNHVPGLNVMLDTETRESDIKQNNLILIGGPLVNKVSGMINPKLPVRFEKTESSVEPVIYSSLSGKRYYGDETGIIVKMKNPYNKEKSIILAAGLRHSGTRAAIICFLKHLDDIAMGNANNPKVLAKVVEGVDLDSDGVVDEADVKE